MEFGLSEEQTLLQDSVTRLIAEQYPLEKVRGYATGDDDASSLRSSLAQMGIPALLIDEDHGGVGLGLLDAALVSEALGHGTAPVPFVASAVMVPRALALGGSDEQKDRWLPKLAAGEITAGAAVSELTGARQDAGLTATSARGETSAKGETSARGETSATLNGRAMFVIDFDADLYLVADKDHKLYLVAADADGLSGSTFNTVDATRKLGELSFDNVSACELSCTPQQTMSVIDWGRVVLAADSLGAAQNMLDQAVAYAMQREQFNRVIASFQAVKHMCAEMAASLEPCRAMMWYAGYAADAGLDEARQYALHTKSHLSEVAQFVARTSTEVHGGMGFTDLVGLHYWFKRIGVNRQLLGSPERLRNDAALDLELIATTAAQEKVA